MRANLSLMSGDGDSQPKAQLQEPLGRLVAAIADWIESHSDEIKALSEWLVRHEDEIGSFDAWVAVQSGCKRTKLYAPVSPVWQEISEAEKAMSDEALEAVILDAYSPGGPGHEKLLEEIRSAPLLQSREREIGEVLNSWIEGRYYVAICGALPLVEGVLASAHGEWQKLHAYIDAINDRIDGSALLTPEEEVGLLLNMSALEMVLGVRETIWKSGQTGVDVSSTILNRHRALHGTGKDWDTPVNATRSMLLLAAVARVAQLLRDQPA